MGQPTFYEEKRAKLVKIMVKKWPYDQKGFSTTEIAVSNRIQGGGDFAKYNGHPF